MDEFYLTYVDPKNKEGLTEKQLLTKCKIAEQFTRFSLCGCNGSFKIGLQQVEPLLDAGFMIIVSIPAFPTMTQELLERTRELLLSNDPWAYYSWYKEAEKKWPHFKGHTLTMVKEDPHVYVLQSYINEYTLKVHRVTEAKAILMIKTYMKIATSCINDVFTEEDSNMWHRLTGVPLEKEIIGRLKHSFHRNIDGIDVHARYKVKLSACKVAKSLADSHLMEKK